MAPEQAGGKAKVGPAADVYALGAILYDCLTGRPPFLAETPLGTIHQVIHNEPVPPRQRQPTCPRDLETVCLKCLEKEPNKRYVTAEELADDLHRFLNGEPIKARPVGWVERHWKRAKREPVKAFLKVLASLAVFVSLGLLVAWWTTRRQADQDRLDAANREARIESQKLQEVAEKRETLVQRAARQGTLLLEQDRMPLGLLWFAEALRLENGDPARERSHRMRIAAMLRALPRLRYFWPTGGEVKVLTFSPDGGLLLATGADGTVRVWNTRTGELAGPAVRDNLPITGAAFSPDGRQIVTTAGKEIAPARSQPPSQARVWDVRTGKPVTPPLLHEGQVRQAAFSPDGKRVVTAGEDKTARVWDVPTGREALRPLQHEGNVFRAAFSPDGRFIVTTTPRNPLVPQIHCWNASDGRSIPLVVDRGIGKERVSHIAFSGDGRKFVTLSQGMLPVEKKTVEVWDATDADRLQKKQLPIFPDAFVEALAFSPRAKWILVVSGIGPNGRARMFDAGTGEELNQLGPLKNNKDVLEAAFSTDGWRIITRTETNSVRLWQASSGTPITPSLVHPGDVRVAAFSLGESLIATATRDGAVRLWECQGNRPPERSFEHRDRLRHAAFSPEGRRIITASQDGTARVWDVHDGKAVTPPLRHDGPVPHAAFSPDGRQVVTASEDKTAQIWDAQTGKPLGKPLRHPHGVETAAFSPDGQVVLTRSWDAQSKTGEVRLWDSRTGQPSGPVIGRDQQIGYAAFSPDGRWILTVNGLPTDKRCQVQILDARSGKPVAAPMVHDGWIAHAEFSPDGRRVVTACWDGTARVWVAATGKSLTGPIEHKPGVWYATFSPDGKRIATACCPSPGSPLPGQVRVWDAETGNPNTPPIQVGPFVRKIAFSPDGRQLATASGYDDLAGVAEGNWGSLRLWDAWTGEPITPNYGFNHLVFDVSFNPDGRHVLWNGTKPKDRSATVWEMDLEDREVKTLIAVAELLAGHRIDRTGDLVPLDAAALHTRWQATSAKDAPRGRP